MIDVDELERRAKAATPGPWVAKPRLVTGRECDCEIVGNEKPQYKSNTPVCRLSIGFTWYEGDKQFIEAANPQTILALIAELRALREVATAAQAWQDDTSGQPAGKYNAFLKALAATKEPAK